MAGAGHLTTIPCAPLVTICLPTIGRMEYLAEALRSLAAQTYPNREVLLLDNASGPATQEVLAAFATAHAHARILRVDERLPMFANFNRGLRAAAGEYVVFFHDDDRYDPRFLESHVALLEMNARTAFAGCNFDVIDGHGNLAYPRRPIRRTGTWRGRFFIERLLRRGRGDLPTPGLVFRRKVLASHGFDEHLSVHWGDFTILMRMAEDWDVGVLAEPLFAWRAHGKNASAMALSQSIPLRTEVFRAYCAEYAGRHPEDERFLRRMRHAVERGHRQGLLWGWISAADDREAECCRRALEGSSVFTASAMHAIDRAGMTLDRRRKLSPALRRVAEALGA